MTSNQNLTVTLVLHEFCKGWIIEKMAHRLCDSLIAAGVQAEVKNSPSPVSRVNHSMIFHYVDVAPGTLNTAAVTHVDDALKIDMIKRELRRGVRAMICMSHMTEDQLAAAGVDRSRLTYSLPANDGDITPRRIVIGITSNCYSDLRKREWMLKKLAGDLPLDAFEFRFFGSGWAETVEALRIAGAAVVVSERSDDYRADYAAIRAAVPQFDYYFYPGLDEGSMGTLDALSAGIKTIITTQGFHLDLPHGITHGFWDYEELRRIFENLGAERQARLDTARLLSWDRYAKRHIEIWTSLLEKDSVPPPDHLMGLVPQVAPKAFEVTSYVGIVRNPFRRELALRFWAPRLLSVYQKTRMKLGALRRRMIQSR